MNAAVSELHCETGDDVVVRLKLRTRNDIQSNGDFVCFAPDDEAERLEVKQASSAVFITKCLPRILAVRLNIIVELSRVVAMIHEKRTIGKLNLSSHFAVDRARIFD